MNSSGCELLAASKVASWNGLQDAWVGFLTLGAGKHPTFINPEFPELRPVSIPNHSTPLNKNTARSILDQLEADLECWEIKVAQTSQEEDTM